VQSKIRSAKHAYSNFTVVSYTAAAVCPINRIMLKYLAEPQYWGKVTDKSNLDDVNCLCMGSGTSF